MLQIFNEAISLPPHFQTKKNCTVSYLLVKTCACNLMKFTGSPRRDENTTRLKQTKASCNIMIHIMWHHVISCNIISYIRWFKIHPYGAISPRKSHWQVDQPQMCWEMALGCRRGPKVVVTWLPKSKPFLMLIAIIITSKKSDIAIVPIPRFMIRVSSPQVRWIQFKQQRKEIHFLTFVNIPEQSLAELRRLSQAWKRTKNLQKSFKNIQEYSRYHFMWPFTSQTWKIGKSNKIKQINGWFVQKLVFKNSQSVSDFGWASNSHSFNQGHHQTCKVVWRARCGWARWCPRPRCRCRRPRPATSPESQRKTTGRKSRAEKNGVIWGL